MKAEALGQSNAALDSSIPGNAPSSSKSGSPVGFADPTPQELDFNDRVSCSDGSRFRYDCPNLDLAVVAIYARILSQCRCRRRNLSSPNRERLCIHSLPALVRIPDMPQPHLRFPARSRFTTHLEPPPRARSIYTRLQRPTLRASNYFRTAGCLALRTTLHTPTAHLRSDTPSSIFLLLSTCRTTFRPFSDVFIFLSLHVPLTTLCELDENVLLQ